MAEKRLQQGLETIKRDGIFTSSDYAAFLALLEKGWPVTMPDYFIDNRWRDLSDMMMGHSECFAGIAKIFADAGEKPRVIQGLNVPLSLIDRNTKTALAAIRRDIGIIRLHMSRGRGVLFADLLPGVRGS